MEKLLKITRDISMSIGENLVWIILAITIVVMIFFIEPANAMGNATCGMQIEEAELEAGDSFPCSMQLVEQETGVCASPMVTETGKEICPIVTPGQAIQNTLSTQLEEVP